MVKTRIEKAAKELFDAITAPDAFPVEVTEEAGREVSSRLLENPRITAALRAVKAALALPDEPAAARCARSVDGTVATASEIYVNDRLFVSADSIEAEACTEDAIEEVRRVIERERKLVRAGERVAEERWGKARNEPMSDAEADEVIRLSDVGAAPDLSDGPRLGPAPEVSAIVGQTWRCGIATLRVVEVTETHVITSHSKHTHHEWARWQAGDSGCTPVLVAPEVSDEAHGDDASRCPESFGGVRCTLAVTHGGPCDLGCAPEVSDEMAKPGYCNGAPDGWPPVHDIGADGRCGRCGIQVSRGLAPREPASTDPLVAWFHKATDSVMEEAFRSPITPLSDGCIANAVRRVGPPPYSSAPRAEVPATLQAWSADVRKVLGEVAVEAFDSGQRAQRGATSTCLSFIADEALARIGPPPSDDAGDGATRIVAERRRQLAKWPVGHDDEHDKGDLRVVAAGLAVHGTDASVLDPCDRVNDGRDAWGLIQKHGRDEVRLLTIAGALIAAEIDRLLRRAIVERAKGGAR